jgi:glycolate oxidase FAD binding subunit
VVKRYNAEVGGERGSTVNSDGCHIDDFGPLPVVLPGSVAELGDLVRRAGVEGQAVYPLGGRTALSVGLPPSRPGLGVDLRALAAVVDYPARDMTITVQAGIRIAELQRLLATENQRLPVDVPHAERATLGGALAVNASGPRRYGFGTFRDYVLGISTVNDEGQETKAGGRVVKNVAGYDLCKLHIGALGTLGVISQVTLKVRPLPEAKALVTLGCEAAALGPLLDQLHQSRTRPVCLDVLNQPAATEVARSAHVHLAGSPWVVAVGFEENERAVEWQVRQVLQEVSSADVEVNTVAGAATDPLWQGFAEFTDRPDAVLGFKANLLPHAVADFCLKAAAFPEGVLLQAHAGSGIVRGHLGAGGLTLERVQAMLKELADAAGAARGNLVLPRCPPEWKRSLPVWGAPRGDLGLMRKVKEQLDPRGLFNPGRFVGGI